MEEEDDVVEGAAEFYSRDTDWREHEEPDHSFESLDYEVVKNTVYLKGFARTTQADMTKKVLWRWVITFFIGVITGLLAFIVQTSYTRLAELKFDWISQLIALCDCVWLPFLIYLVINVGLAAFAAMFVAFVEPVASGAGVPELTCYLNGIKMPKIIRFKTFVTKVVAGIAALAAGLPVSKEAPMIHSGAIVAAGISQGKTTTFGCDAKTLYSFRNDTEKRDFVNVGLAAGVAVSFGAPIGGVLFTLEQSASFWNYELTWRTFFAGMMATFVLNFVLSGITTDVSWGRLSESGLLTFGSFGDTQTVYTVYQFPFFIIMGVLGGLFGAFFNFLNTHLTKFRLKYVSNPFLRFLEVVLLAALITMLSFFLSYLAVRVQSCRPLLPESKDNVVQFFCPDGYYNDMATMFFTTQDDAIKSLLHNTSEFSRGALVVFFIVYFMLACYAYGTAVPAGLFIPCILCGCSYGRFVGIMLQEVFPDLDVDPGTFALIGAAALLGGVVRMTISLAVIMLEATNDITYGLPVIVTLLVSKWVGDYFNPGLYYTHIILNKAPLLVEEAPEIMRRFTAKHIMARPVICFRQVERVDTVWKVLTSTDHNHNGFPVVAMPYGGGTSDDDPSSRPVFVGLILRSQLITLLRKKAFKESPMPSPDDVMGITQDDFIEMYPRQAPIESVQLSEEDRSFYMDMTPYMNPDPYVIRQKATLTRVFTLFRTMGLRHLVVVNKHNNVVGMITRKDMVNLEDKLMHRKNYFQSMKVRTNAGDSSPAQETTLDSPVRSYSSSGYKYNWSINTM